MLYIDEQSQIVRVIIDEDINVYSVKMISQLQPDFVIELENVENESESNKYKQLSFDFSLFKYSGLYNMYIYGGSPKKELRVDLLKVIKEEIDSPVTYKKNNNKF